MTPIQYAIARAAQQTQDPELLQYAQRFDHPQSAAGPMESVRAIVKSTAGESITAPIPQRPAKNPENFTFTDYYFRYAPSRQQTVYERTRQEQINRAERDWERQAIAEAEAEALLNRARRLANELNFEREESSKSGTICF